MFIAIPVLHETDCKVAVVGIRRQKRRLSPDMLLAPKNAPNKRTVRHLNSSNNSIDNRKISEKIITKAIVSARDKVEDGRRKRPTQEDPNTDPNYNPTNPPTY